MLKEHPWGTAPTALGYSTRSNGGLGWGDFVLWRHMDASVRGGPAGSLPPLLSPAPASEAVPGAGGNKQSDASDGMFPPHEGAAGRPHPVSGHPPPTLSTPRPCGGSLHPQSPFMGHLPPAEERSSSGSRWDALDGCPHSARPWQDLPARLAPPRPFSGDTFQETSPPAGSGTEG